jgi:uncharacterized membrane protein YgdD (TMEM256/DUF423 family)
MSRGLAARIAAGIAMLGVAYGAFGAHGLKAQLAATPNGMENWKTAVFYHLIHAVMMYVVAFSGVNRRAWWLFGTGILFFSGSLYCMALWPWMSWMWPLTPLGGVLLLGGWATLMLFKGMTKPEARIPKE